MCPRVSLRQGHLYNSRSLHPRLSDEDPSPPPTPTDTRVLSQNAFEQRCRFNPGAWCCTGRHELPNEGIALRGGMDVALAQNQVRLQTLATAAGMVP